MTPNGHLDELERLVKLRQSGDLSEEEFLKEKAKLLSGGTVPFYRRLWVVVLLTALILTFPVALLILATGPVYRKSEGAWNPIKDRSRYIYAGALGLWFIAAIINLASGPSISERWKESAPSDETAQTSSPVQDVSDDTNAPEACDDSDAEDQIKSVLANSAASRLVTVTIEDFGRPKELFYDKKDRVRMCQADAILNTGATPLSYNFFFGPSGKPMIEVKEGADAYGSEVFKAAVEQAAAHAAPEQQTVPSNDKAPAANRLQSPAQAPTDDSNGVSTPAASDSIESHYSAAYANCEKQIEGDNWSRAGEYACVDDERKVQQDNLNQLVASMMGQLDSAGQARLRDLQQAWVKQREADCNPPASTTDMGNADEMSEPSCELEANVKRIIQLQRLQAASSGN